MATPGRLRDYVGTNGTCSSSSEACTAPSYTDACVVGQCSATCNSSSSYSWSGTTCQYNCNTGSTCTYASSCTTRCSAGSSYCVSGGRCYTSVGCSSSGCTETDQGPLDDGLSCTTDTCTSTGVIHTINSGWCSIGGTCYSDTTTNPTNQCQRCSSSTSQTSWSSVANGTQCGNAINYCAVQSTCDTRQHYQTCQSGTCTSPPFTPDVDVSGTSCSGQSCGSYADYCLATPGKLRDYAATAGTCSGTSNDTCTSPSFNDYCQTGQCGAECNDGNTCSSSQCTGASNAFYQTRSSTCQGSCLCPAWGSYGTCQESWNNCSQRVQCYTGTGCDTSNGVCACQSGYTPNGSGGCALIQTYYWDIGGWGSCSVSCGTGTQTRTVVCRRQSDGAQVAESNCSSPKPSTSQSCDAGSCAATTCSADGCYGTLKWRDYPATVANQCVSGTCTSNTCTYTEACSVSSCSAECETNNCSTSQCDNNANGYRYQQTRSSTCQGDCLCPAWSAYQTCQDSWNNCPTSGSYSRVQCYQGTGCNTATNACTCNTGYQPDGAGGCSLILTPDFQVSNSGPITVVQGGSTQDVTMTVTSLNSFASSVALSDNCSSSNLSCSWPSGTSCTPPANGTCTRTLRVGAGSATTGGKTVTVTGTSGSSRTTNVGVTVTTGANQPPNKPILIPPT